MKKFFLSFLFSLTICLTSCGVYAQEFLYDDVYTDLTYSRIITYGTPYYIDGIISYYLYNNMYYYPYIWEGRRFFRPFDHMQPRGFVFRPELGHRPDMHFRGPEINRSREPIMHTPNKSSMNHFDRSSSRMQLNVGGQRNMPQTRQFQIGRGRQPMNIGAPRNGGMSGRGR